MRRNAPTIRIPAVLILFALLLTAPPLTRRAVMNAAARDATLAGVSTVLSIDDGSTSCVAGDPSEDKLGFGWVNKLTPPTYPATLRAITIGFNRAESGVRPNSIFRIVVFLDPESNGPANGQVPAVTFLGRVRGNDQIITFDLIAPIRIESGSFVVGAIDQFEGAEFPALIDVPGTSTPPGSESFTSFNNGANWRPVSQVFTEPSACNPTGSSAGSWVIRATVETDPVDVFETTATLHDPLAIEPWSVDIHPTGTDAYVTNYGSDNLTIIKTSDNSITNVEVGDGPEGTPDGPFGVVTNLAGNKVFVTLFGSNTVPTKADPVDYSEVGDGRVQIFSRAASGALAPSATINVGKGPRFPEVVRIAGTGTEKLYIPCGGSNRVDVIDVNTNTKIREIAVGNDPSSCVLGISGVKLYVTNFGDGTISVINTRTDQKIRDIPVPTFTPPGSTTPVRASNPWKAAVSPVNGNIYVTYWGTEGNVEPNGAIVEIDACSDEFVRAIFDDSTRGTPPGAETGGGGPFGIASFQPFFFQQPLLIYTNDGAGAIGALDSRTDQVVSAPHITVCPRPRDLACARINNKNIAYVACGLPDNSVLTVNIPSRPENVSGFPVVNTAEVAGKTRVVGRNFVNGARLQIIDPVTGECVAFARPARIKKNGTVIIQKGPLSDGRAATSFNFPFLRVINPDQTVRLFTQSPVPNP